MTITTTRRTQQGMLLLEGLIAILLFSVGILAIVGLQANALRAVTQTKYRSDAGFFADEVVSQMWANRSNIASYAYAGTGAPPAAIANWVGRVQGGLPGAQNHAPKITVNSTAYVGPPNYTAYQVTVQVFWQMPDELNAVPQPPPHSVTTTASIQCC